MKARIFFALLFWVPAIVNSQGGAKQPIAPNVYHLTGGQMKVEYSTTSFNGTPRLTYHDGNQTLSFAGDQIRQTKTEIGTLVSVTLHMTVDSGSTGFTLLVPTVNLSSSSSSAPVHTYGITTAHKFSVVPAMNQGQTELYTTTELSGTASVVFF